MDSIAKIKPHKDTSFAMLLEAQRRRYQLHYAEITDLFVQNGKAYALTKVLSVQDTSEAWFEFTSEKTTSLNSFDIILMRKDPPFNMDYIYCTYILELAEKTGVFVVNKPASLRDANEKLFTSWFPQCCPETLVSSQESLIKQFAQAQGDIIIKPLDGMGGEAVLRLKHGDPNLSVGIELLSQHGHKPIMAQRYIPEVTQGDKRILVVHGHAIPYALARIPQKGETRANLAAGGIGKVQALSERDYWICEQVRHKLLDKGLYFVGLDVIGDYLTEINVTSPTCAREIEKISGINIMQLFFDGIEKLL